MWASLFCVLVLCPRNILFLTFSRWKKNYTVQWLFNVSDYSKWGRCLSARVSPRKFFLPLILLILGKCTWSGCTESALFCSFENIFFAKHVLCAGRGVEVGEKDISFGGSTSALHRWSRMALVHLLWLTTHWGKAHFDSACLQSFKLSRFLTYAAQMIAKRKFV